MKKCSSCLFEKAPNEFYVDLSHKNGLSSTCRVCAKARNNAYHRLHPGKYRSHQWKLLGIKNNDGSLFLENDYDRLYQIQGGKCAICKVHSSTLPKQLAVDHNHATNIVRGLLCNPCNTGLGQYQDDAERLFQAGHYLNRYKVVN